MSGFAVQKPKYIHLRNRKQDISIFERLKTAFSCTFAWKNEWSSLYFCRSAHFCSSTHIHLLFNNALIITVMLALKHSIFIVSMLFYLPTAQQIGVVRLDLLSFVILRSGRVSDYTRENGILIYFTFLVIYL